MGGVALRTLARTREFLGILELRGGSLQWKAGPPAAELTAGKAGAGDRPPWPMRQSLGAGASLTGFYW